MCALRDDNLRFTLKNYRYQKNYLLVLYNNRSFELTQGERIYYEKGYCFEKKYIIVTCHDSCGSDCNNRL